MTEERPLGPPPGHPLTQGPPEIIDRSNDPLVISGIERTMGWPAGTLVRLETWEDDDAGERIVGPVFDLSHGFVPPGMPGVSIKVICSTFAVRPPSREATLHGLIAGDAFLRGVQKVLADAGDPLGWEMGEDGIIHGGRLR